jgi:hypothetical protein
MIVSLSLGGAEGQCQAVATALAKMAGPTKLEQTAFARPFTSDDRKVTAGRTPCTKVRCAKEQYELTRDYF